MIVNVKPLAELVEDENVGAVPMARAAPVTSAVASVSPSFVKAIVTVADSPGARPVTTIVSPSSATAPAEDVTS